jgi:hypothetical protein
VMMVLDVALGWCLHLFTTTIVIIAIFFVFLFRK